MKKLILFSALLIFSCSSDYEIVCVDDVNLSTLPATNITRTSATLNGVIFNTPLNCDVPAISNQGFVYSTSPQPTIEESSVSVGTGSVNTTIENLESNTTYYYRTFLTNALGNFYGV